MFYVYYCPEFLRGLRITQKEYTKGKDYGERRVKARAQEEAAAAGDVS
jgi:hypothetical protein